MNDLEAKLQRAWAKQVATRRRDLGLTQAEFGERIGYAQPEVSKIETGKVGFNPLLMLRLAVALDADVADLFAWPIGITDAARFHFQAVAA